MTNGWTRTRLGALGGALVALVWIVWGAGAAALMVVLAALGAAIGWVLDRPDAAIGLLQRLQR